jgi:hypothetical protein
LGSLKAAVDHDSGAQILADQAQHPFVMNFSGYTMH